MVAATKFGNVFTIPTGTSTSDTVDLGITDHESSLIGLELPAAFTSTSLTFNVSNDDTTYQQLINEAGSAVTVTVAAAKTISFKQDVRSQLSGWRFVQIISGSAETPGRVIKGIVK